jgi:transcriptional regulator with XRE-family HTH domain
MSEKSERARLRGRAHLATTIESLRRQRNFSLDDLADRSELDLDVLEEVLRGDAEADLGLIYRIAGALDAEPADLFKGIAWVPPDGDRAGYLVEEAEREGD